MNYSYFWARLLGLYVVILAGGMFFHLKNFQTLLTTMAQSPALLMIMGIFTLLLGLAIVVTHQVWRGWPILVTILGYWISLKGIFLLFFPAVINQTMMLWQDHNLYLAPLPSFIIGLILLFCGFKNKMVK